MEIGKCHGGKSGWERHTKVGKRRLENNPDVPCRGRVTTDQAGVLFEALLDEAQSICSGRTDMGGLDVHVEFLA